MSAPKTRLGRESMSDNKEPTQLSDHERLKEHTAAGDIGDEQMPAGEIKTDKCAWNYAANRIIQDDLPKKLKDFLAGL